MTLARSDDEQNGSSIICMTRSTLVGSVGISVDSGQQAFQIRVFHKSASFSTSSSFEISGGKFVDTEIIGGARAEKDTGQIRGYCREEAT